MMKTLVDLLQTAAIVVLAWDWNRQRKTLGIVARMAAGAAKEPETAPDPEKARRAAEAIDKFNDGIASILGYTGEGDA